MGKSSWDQALTFFLLYIAVISISKMIKWIIQKCNKTKNEMSNIHYVSNDSQWGTYIDYRRECGHGDAWHKHILPGAGEILKAESKKIDTKKQYEEEKYYI